MTVISHPFWHSCGTTRTVRGRTARQWPMSVQFDTSRGLMWYNNFMSPSHDRPEPQTGSYAPNAREGARSEYLAQYVFSRFGTSLPVLRQEDHGLDLHCTLSERKGRRAWPVAYYSVQVKSTNRP